MKKIFYILLAIFALGYVAWSLGVMCNNGFLPQAAGLDLQQMEYADSAIHRAMADGEFSGAVLCVVRRADDGSSMGKVAYLKAYGLRSVLSADGKADSTEMTTDAVFDLASLSKSVGTTLAFMRLVEDGRVRLTDRVDRYIEGFKPWDSLAEVERPKKWRKRAQKPEMKVVKSEPITIAHLLTHTSGLPSYISVEEFLGRMAESNTPPALYKDSLVRYIAVEAKRLSQPGQKVRYGCLNFVVLQAIIERVTGQRLDEFARCEVFEPLRLRNTRYNPTDAVARAHDASVAIVPTEQQADGRVLCGEAHDPIARLINRGVSGNAGLFSSAEDLAVVASLLMNGGVVRLPMEGWRGQLGFTTPCRLYSRSTVDRFLSAPDAVAEHCKALGWDAAYDRGGCYGDLMTPRMVVSHTGYTGTSMAIDLSEGVAVILLTNRVHPKDSGSLGRTRAVVANVVMGAM